MDVNMTYLAKIHFNLKMIPKLYYKLVVKVRNMKMDLNTYGTWRRVTFDSAKSLVTPYNIV